MWSLGARSVLAIGTGASSAWRPEKVRKETPSPSSTKREGKEEEPEEEMGRAEPPVGGNPGGGDIPDGEKGPQTQLIGQPR